MGNPSGRWSDIYKLARGLPANRSGKQGALPSSHQPGEGL